MNLYRLLLVSVGVAAFFAAFNDSSAATLRVPSQYSSIQLAIEAALDGDTVLVADGTYYENIRFLGKAITVASHYLVDMDAGHVDSTIINGSQPAHPDSGSTVFFIDGEDTSSVLCGMTITGGTGSLNPAGVRVGGGVWVKAGSGAKLRRNRIMFNVLTDPDGGLGAGILAGSPYAAGGWLVLEENDICCNTITATKSIGAIGVYCAMNARIERNRIERNEGMTGQIGDGGAGLCCYTEVVGGKELLMRGNSILGNGYSSSGVNPYGESGLGGGMIVSGFRGIIDSNIIADNQLEGPGILYGGGAMLIANNDSLQCRGNWISGNRLIGGGERWGGGVCIWNCSPRITNNVIVGNEGRMGGGIYVGGTKPTSSLQMINNTICRNSAPYGSGVYAVGSSPVIVNTILWNNGPEIQQSGDTATIVYSDVKGGWVGEGNINVEPAFLDSTYRLSDSSPCIGAGIDSTYIGGTWYRAPSSCFYGDPRPNPDTSRPDIGACENPRGEPLTEGVDRRPDGLPTSFTLDQNYPNPFNPSTTIKYELPKSAAVKLIVFDLLGREVSVLVNERMDAGVHEVKFDASNLPSGAYLYRLQTEDSVQSRKLLLLR
jgi:hypothetical protein